MLLAALTPSFVAYRKGTFKRNTHTNKREKGCRGTQEAKQAMFTIAISPAGLLVKPEFDKFTNTAFLQGKHLHHQDYY